MLMVLRNVVLFFFFSSRRRHTRFDCDWSSDVCSSDLPAFFLLGMLIQRVVLEPNRFADEHNQLSLTLGVALFLENLALGLWQGDFRTVRPAYASASFVVGEALVEVPRLVACGGAIVMAVVLFAFLKLTDVGKAIRALAEEPEGAMLMGINVSRDRKSTRLNSSHSQISYAVFCLKKKKKNIERISD